MKDIGWDALIAIAPDGADSHAIMVIYNIYIKTTSGDGGTRLIYHEKIGYAVPPLITVVVWPVCSIKRGRPVEATIVIHIFRQIAIPKIIRDKPIVIRTVRNGQEYTIGVAFLFAGEQSSLHTVLCSPCARGVANQFPELIF